MTSTFLSRFTPSMMSAATLEAIFVQRHQLLEDLIEGIRESATTANKHFRLLVGARGMGKTHTIALLYHRVSKMDDLRDKLLIAWLREEEWGVSSWLDLLLRIFRAIQQEYPNEYQTNLEKEVNALYQLSSKEAEKKAADLLREFVGKRTLLLLMENLDEIFNGLDDIGQKQLRGYIQNYSFITIVATSQSLFAGVKNKDAPFYGFFYPHHLEELKLEEVVDLLSNIAELEDDRELEAFIASPIGKDRIEAIHFLAGGNHRVYVIFAEFLTRESLDDLVNPFMKTLDELTPYYQARMQWLSAQQRKIVEFLCDIRKAVTVKEIAQHCFISHQTASSQLKDLREKGYVRSEAKGRESYYELREVLMRFCLDVKKQRGEPIRLFVDFLRLWYTKNELEKRLANCTLLEKQYIQYALQAISLDREQNLSQDGKDKYPAWLLDFVNDLSPSPSPARRGELDSTFSSFGVRSDELTFLQELLQAEIESNSDSKVIYPLLKQHQDRLNDAFAQLWQAWCSTALAKASTQETQVIAKLIKNISNHIHDVSLTSKANNVEIALLGYEIVLSVYTREEFSYQWAKTQYNLGRAYSERIKGDKGENLEKAIELFQGALQVHTETSFPYDWAKIQNNLGSFYAQRIVGDKGENYEKAIECFQAALQVYTQSAFPYEWANTQSNFGLAYSNRIKGNKVENLDKAIEYFQSALQVYTQSAFPCESANNKLLLGIVYYYRILAKQIDYYQNDWHINIESVIFYDYKKTKFYPKKTYFKKFKENEFKNTEKAIECIQSALKILIKHSFSFFDPDDWKFVNKNLNYLAEEIIPQLFEKTKDVDLWRSKISNLIEIYQEQKIISGLGKGLTLTIPSLMSEMVSDKAARVWLELWQELTSEIPEFQIPLRLLNTAVRYKETKGDDRVLLELAIEERNLLKPLLGIDEIQF